MIPIVVMEQICIRTIEIRIITIMNFKLRFELKKHAYKASTIIEMKVVDEIKLLCIILLVILLIPLCTIQI